MELSAKLDTRGARLSLALLSDSQQRASINRVVNLAAGSTRKFASKLIREDLNVKDKALRGGLITVSKAGAAGGNASDREARVTIKAKGPPLTDFRGTRQLKAGLKVKIYKKRGAKVLKGRFEYPGRSGGVLAAERARVGEKRVPRGPVKLLFAPGAAQFAAKPEIASRLVDHAAERMVVELERDVTFRLKRQTERRGAQP